MVRTHKEELWCTFQRRTRSVIKERGNEQRGQKFKPRIDTPSLSLVRT